ncbi:protoporphyrinogen oxidase [Halorussus halophilus]|uniref:protoporphyrinogen oxidase n=1 Tax=Halorussus halophilus TaxID=2650975 RepID=UPI00130198F0|nr:protoporphyrinogen oxidase [Halorussus halophilus]
MRVGIIGGGITGLATHHYLREAGIESVVFEADDDPGGVVRSETVAGRVLDFGPQRTRLTPSISSLVESLGLESELREAADVPLYVYHHGTLRRVPQTPRESVTTDLLSWGGKLRVLLEPATGPAVDGETVEAFLSRKFGDEVARYYFGPLYGGIYGSHPDEMLMKYSLSKALDSAGIEGSVLTSVARKLLAGREAPPIVSFDDGLQRLPESLANAHGESVELGTPIRAVRRGGSAFVLETPTGETVVDELVVTTPADVTAGLFGDVSPDSADSLRRLNYNPQAIVHLYSEADLSGAGYQVQYEEDFRTLGVTWNASLLDRDGVYTCYLGGARNPKLVEWSDERLASVARTEFEEITGRSARALSVHRLARGMPAYDRTWTALDRISMPEGVHLCTNYTSRAGIPGRIREAKTTAGRLASAERRTATARSTP